METNNLNRLITAITLLGLFLNRPLFFFLSTQLVLMIRLRSNTSYTDFCFPRASWLYVCWLDVMCNTQKQLSNVCGSLQASVLMFRSDDKNSIGAKSWHKSRHHQLILKAGSSCLFSGDSTWPVSSATREQLTSLASWGFRSTHATNTHTHRHTQITRRLTESWLDLTEVSRGRLCAQVCFLDFRGEETVCSVPTDWSTGRLINNWISIKKVWVGEHWGCCC